MTEVKKLLIELYDKTQEAIRTTNKIANATPDAEYWKYRWVLKVLRDTEAAITFAIDDLDKQENPK